MNEKFYITTPIYYVNDVPHIGHAYTTVAADVMARYQRMLGKDVYYLTGTDEHGQKVDDAAKEKDQTPQQYVDKIVVRFKQAWKALNISNDDFIRTTEERHIKTVQGIFKKLMDKGDIYMGEYEGWYCRPCETFWTETQLKEKTDNPKQYVCLTCNRSVEKLKEESFFFKLSKYQEQLLEYINKNPLFIQPESRKNEVLSFIKQGLKDISVSRTTFSWGVQVLDNPSHVVYVWFDALINYISALGYNAKDNSFEKKYWPANVHVMGKEIVRFHAVIWPCMLMALDVPLPKKVFGHGWWTVEGEKMSKSKGNVIDPIELSKKINSIDAVRYFLMREVFFGDDGNFSMQSFENRYNADLANDLGNLLHRSLNMLEKYFNGVVPNLDEADSKFDELSKDLVESANALKESIKMPMNELIFSTVLDLIWQRIGKANKYIEIEAPWKLAKDENKIKQLKSVMYNLIYTLQVVAESIYPFMPSTSVSMLKQLGLKANEPINLGQKIAGIKIAKGNPLFPRLEKK